MVRMIIKLLYLNCLPFCGDASLLSFHACEPSCEPPFCGGRRDDALLSINGHLQGYQS